MVGVGTCFSLLGEEGLQLLVVPEKILVQQKQRGERDAAVCGDFTLIFDIYPFFFFTVQGIKQRFICILLNSHYLVIRRGGVGSVFIIQEKRQRVK